MRKHALLPSVALCFLSGCGYSTVRPFPTDIQTVHVEMFHSREFRRELEFRLTEAIVKRIQMDTPYRVVAKPSADAVMTGEILSVKNRTFGDEFHTDRPREIGSTVTVRYRLQDLRNGEFLVDMPKVVYQTSYIPPVGESFTQGAIRGIDGLAERLVEGLESKW